MTRHDYYPFYFGRNRGIYTDAQVAKIRGACVGIAGLGGSGGYSLLFLVQMGFESFKIADFDVYEEHNKNRQIGAFRQNIGRPKLDCLLEIAKGLNPYIDVETFPHGIQPGNAEAFVAGTDFVIEVMDFHAPDAKFALHRAATAASIFISTSPSPAYGAPVFNFGPNTPTFGEAFGLHPERPFATQDDAQRFVERLVKPVVAGYPEADGQRILRHQKRAAIGETHLSTNIMGVTASAQLLCMACLETIISGAPRVLMPMVTILDHLTMQYQTVHLDSFRWEH